MGRLLAHRGSAGCGVRCCHNGRCCRGAQKANVNVETRLLLSVELRGPRLAIVKQPAGVVRVRVRVRVRVSVRVGVGVRVRVRVRVSTVVKQPAGAALRRNELVPDAPG